MLKMSSGVVSASPLRACDIRKQLHIPLAGMHGNLLVDACNIPLG